MMRAFRRILHATDFSRASAAAFAKAVDLARQNGAELILIHVIPPPAPLIGDGYLAPAMYDELEALARRDAQKQLAGLVARAQGGKVRARSVLTDGVPYERIAHAARSLHADLIVMGTHGRTGLSRLFMGSVVERVIPRAPCPVLAVGARRGKRG
jgi:nucleotide-binding universal stress UspA family protein